MDLTISIEIVLIAVSIENLYAYTLHLFASFDVDRVLIFVLHVTLACQVHLSHPLVIFHQCSRSDFFFISKTAHAYKVERSSVLEVAMAVVNRSIYLTFYRTSHFEWFVYNITFFFGCSRFTFITILFLESIFMGIWCFCGSEIEIYKHSRDIYVLFSSRHTSKTKWKDKNNSLNRNQHRKNNNTKNEVNHIHRIQDGKVEK